MTFDGEKETIELLKRIAVSLEKIALSLDKTEQEEKAALERDIRRTMQDPKYWKLQDPETVRRVEEGFKRLYG